MTISEQIKAEAERLYPYKEYEGIMGPVSRSIEVFNSFTNLPEERKYFYFLNDFGHWRKIVKP